jgi:membrane protein
MQLANAREFLVEVFDEWSADKIMQIGAAIAYYAIFSAAPLLVIAIAVASFFFGEKAAKGQIVRQIEGTIGAPAAELVQDILRAVHAQGSSLFAGLTATAVLLFGASGAFLQLQEGLNTIWKVQSKPGMALWDVLRNRLWSFLLVLATGLLLLAPKCACAAAASRSFPSRTLSGCLALRRRLNRYRKAKDSGRLWVRRREPKGRSAPFRTFLQSR